MKYKWALSLSDWGMQPLLDKEGRLTIVPGASAVVEIKSFLPVGTIWEDTDPRENI